MIGLTEAPVRIGYVVKRYPRFSETFVVNEILAHERAGLDIDIFSLKPPVDTHFQDLISHVSAGVTYLDSGSIRGDAFWAALQEAAALSSGHFWTTLLESNPSSAREVYQAALLAKEIQLRGLTHLHAHFASSATSVARMAAGIAGISYSFTAHAKDIFHESVDPIDLRRKIREASSVVTVSDYNLDFLRESFGANARNVRRIYNGLDLACFPYQEPVDRPLHIAAVGRLVEKKGFGVLIDACALLRDRGVDFSCEIIGGGELEAELQARISARNLDGWINMTGPLPQSEVKRRLTQAALLAAPCVTGTDGNKDGLPTILIEAMALGTPCISTDVTGVPEIVHHGETGLIAGQDDPDSLAQTFEQLLDDRDLQVQLARRARRLVEERFDIHRNAAEIRELFQVPATGLRTPSFDRIEVPA
ncbi:glycosyltransferase family 4 protein [soil metagenome]